MLFALTAFFFALGFSTATFASKDPSKTRNQVARFLNNLRSIVKEAKRTNGLVSPVKLVEDLPNPDSHRRQSQSREGYKLLTRDQVEQLYSGETWERRAYEDFKETLLGRKGKTFPCIYGTMGFRGKEHRYVFLDSDNPSEPRNVRNLGPTMQSYLSQARELGANTSLVIFCGPSDEMASTEEYNRRFWEFLRGLRYCDSQEWPADVPAETTDPHWTFCFEGEPLFPIALTPAHDKRRSRYASNLTIAMQPKYILDKLLSTPERRKSATEKVRKLLREYDEVDISPDLTEYGVPGTRESRQLCLKDVNETCECPYIDFERE